VRSFVDPTHELLVTVEVSAEVARVARSRPDNVETGHREQLRREPAGDVAAEVDDLTRVVILCRAISSNRAG